MSKIWDAFKEVNESFNSNEKEKDIKNEIDIDSCFVCKNKDIMIEDGYLKPDIVQ